MTRSIQFIVFFSALILTSVSRAAESPDAQPRGTPSANAAEKLVTQLDHPDYNIRNAAALQLNNLTGDALKVVEAASRDESLSAEAHLRLQAALKILKPRAAREDRDRLTDEWEKRILHEAYHQSGQANPAYDAAVDQAIDGFRELRIEPKQMERDPAREKVAADLKIALDKGCDDPYVQCLYYSARARQWLTRFHADNAAQKSFYAVLDGKYHPAVKLIVVHRFLPCMWADRRKILKELPQLIDQVVADPQIPQDELYNLMTRLAGAFSQFASPLKTFDPAADEFLKLRAGQLDSLLFKGFYEYLGAYEKRGRANEVAPDAMKAFQDGLAHAETTLQKAWEMDPTDARAATLMISVKRGQGQAGGGRDAMEQWFKRAFEANPDNYDACQRKLSYLQGYASHDDVINFGKECLQTHNWRAGIPYILSIAHEVAASGNRTYLPRPDVWKDIEDVYEGAFLSFPNDTSHRNHYVYLALLARKYDVATRHIQILGDKSDWFYDPARHAWGDAHYKGPTTRPTTRLTTRPTTRPTRPPRSTTAPANRINE